MRTPVDVALALLLVGCGSSGDGTCEVDNDCGGDLACARNGECLPASEVRPVRVTWTIRGMTASSYTCAGTPDFYLLFGGTQPNDFYGYEPVPCDAGLFTVDKLPRRLVSVEIGVRGGFSDIKAFDAQGNAAFDVMP
jgi:hypothetical protein